MKTIVNFRNIAVLLLGTLFLASCDKSDSDLKTDQTSKPGKGILVTSEPIFSMSLDGDLSSEEAQAQYNAAYKEFISKNSIAGRTQDVGMTLIIKVRTGTAAWATCLGSELWWSVNVNGVTYEGVLPNSMASVPGQWQWMTLGLEVSHGTSSVRLNGGGLWILGLDYWQMTGFGAGIGGAEGYTGDSSFEDLTSVKLGGSNEWRYWASQKIGIGSMVMVTGD